MNTAGIDVRKYTGEWSLNLVNFGARVFRQQEIMEGSGFGALDRRSRLPFSLSGSRSLHDRKSRSGQEGRSDREPRIVSWSCRHNWVKSAVPSRANLISRTSKWGRSDLVRERGRGQDREKTTKIVLLAGHLQIACQDLSTRDGVVLLVGHLLIATLYFYFQSSS